MTLDLSHYEKGHGIKKYLAGAKRNHSVVVPILINNKIKHLKKI